MNTKTIETLTSFSNSSPGQAQAPEGHGLEGFTAQELFPGRTSIRIRDVARALGIVRQQVVDLIEEYRDTDGRSGLGAINVASGLHRPLLPNAGKERRCQWRIPVAAFDAFIHARTNRESAERGGGLKPESPEPGNQSSAPNAPASARRRELAAHNRKSNP
jgi:hypothetical protein